MPIYSSCTGSVAGLLNKIVNIVISMGAGGAFDKSENFTGLIPAVKVRVVDITAVGDVFNGALAVALSAA